MIDMTKFTTNDTGNNVKTPDGTVIAPDSQVCRHHWHLDSTGNGVCQLCGAEQKFSTSYYKVVDRRRGKEVRRYGD